MYRIVSLTEPGRQLAQRLRSCLPESKHWHKPKPFTEQVQQAFLAGDALIMICASGIVVRTLAPVLQDKYRDPPVLVLDEAGQFVIPLLSGHEGGANQLAARIAGFLQAQHVLTTAQPYLQPEYAVGMGCERGCPAEHLYELLLDCLSQARLELADISSINSIALKADEQGLIELAAQVGKPFLTWDVEPLRRVEHWLSIRSDYVFKTVGVYGVAESAALLAVVETGCDSPQLVLAKQKTQRATCAIAGMKF